MSSGRATRLFAAMLILIGLVLAVVQIPAPNAAAAGPPYSGEVTAATGPAYFGPAPNPVPYCENPTYFDPLPENVNPIGRIDVTGQPNSSVTTNGITLDFELTAEGNPGTQYPGFFPGGGEGGPGDQPKGVEMASDDAATISLSQPLFYSQWIFTDVDRANEGFFVTPQWTDPANPGQVAVFGGDANFTLSTTTQTTASFNDTDTVSQDSEAIEGRVQVDFLGAVTGIDLLRDTGNGQSGFAIGGGCEPIGVSKEVTSGPTWNGTGFDVTYTIRVRNNLPSTATISGDVDNALADAAVGFATGDPVGIDMTNVTLEDILADSAFASVTVVDLDNPSGNVATNDLYDGITDTALIPPGETIAPESNEDFVLELVYTPEAAGPLGPTCANTYDLENQATATGTAAGVDVQDLSDSGANPDPGAPNAGGGVNDPTIVTFDCPPPVADATIQIEKTVLAGPMATCPAFGSGVVGVGTPLDVEIGDTVTYCIAVNNPSTVEVTDVVVTDDQAPAGFDGSIGTLAANGGNDSVQFDLEITDTTPVTNTAFANGTGPGGPVPEVNDPAEINPDTPPPPAAILEIEKTVIAGPNGTCPAFGSGVAGAGTPLDVEIGDTVTYCIAVNNPSTVDVTDVVVTDDQAPAGFDGSIGTLAANGGNDSVQFDLPITATTPTTNTAQANGNGPGGPVPEVEDPAVINPADPPPPDGSIEIVKTVIVGPNGTCPDFAAGVVGVGTPLDVSLGDTVTYCISVNNPSTVEVTDVVVADDQAPAGFDGTIGTLAPGTSGTVQFDLLVNGDTPTTNTASATGTGPNGPLPEVEDPAEINPMQPPAAITLSKTIVKDGVDCADAVEGTDEFVLGVVGDAITWCFEVTNSGQVPLTDVLFTDTPAGITDQNLLDGVTPPVLPVGESISFSLAATIPADGFDNVASVTADPSDDAGVPIVGASEVSDQNTAANNETAVTLVKTVIAGPNGNCASAQDLITVNQGTEVTYCFTITNTGGVDILVTEVSDDTLSTTVPVPAADQIIAPDTSITVSMDAIADGDIVNIASINGVPVLPGGEPFPDPPPLNPEDPAEVETLLSDVSIVKTAALRTAQVNGVLQYELDVSNAGPDPAEDVVVVDNLPVGLQIETPASADGWTCTVVTDRQMRCERAEPLGVGETDTLEYTVRINSSAPIGSDLVNTATVTSSTPDADPTNNEDTETVVRVPPTSFTPPTFSPPIDPPTVTTPPAPAPSPVLAITGQQSWLMVFMSLSMAMSGGVLWIASRRRFAEEDDEG